MQLIFHRFFILLIILTFITHCSDDYKEEEYKGKISVTVNTNSELWGYPQVGHTLAATSGDAKDGTWMYGETGGVGWDTTGHIGDWVCGADDDWLEDLADETIGSDDLGDRINIVYLFNTLIEDLDGYTRSNNQPVLYRGTSSSNNSTITIGKIAPGDYYVVAFYDYNYGGNRENLLNRYDRYSFYDSDSLDIGSPFVDEADTITITEEIPVEITLTIHENWVIGKPNTGGGGMGRIFLKSDDTAMKAGDRLPIRIVDDYCALLP